MGSVAQQPPDPPQCKTDKIVTDTWWWFPLDMAKLCVCVALVLCVFIYRCGFAKSGINNNMECSLLQCPMHYLPKVGMRQLSFKCVNPSCDAQIDILTCCDPAAVCDEMSCPAGTRRVANSSTTRCHGVRCVVQEDLDRCCEKVESTG